MKFLVLMSRGQGGHPSPDAANDLSARLKGWMREQSRNGRIEATYAFIEGGGFMVANADSIEDLHELVHSNPSSMFMTLEVRVLLDFEQSIDRFSRYFESGFEQAFHSGEAQ